MDYYSKYIKYKTKYLNLKKKLSGSAIGDTCVYTGVSVGFNCGTDEYCADNNKCKKRIRYGQPCPPKEYKCNAGVCHTHSKTKKKICS